MSGPQEQENSPQIPLLSSKDYPGLLTIIQQGEYLQSMRSQLRGSGIPTYRLQLMETIIRSGNWLEFDMFCFNKGLSRNFKNSHDSAAWNIKADHPDVTQDLISYLEKQAFTSPASRFQLSLLLAGFPLNKFPEPVQHTLAARKTTMDFGFSAVYRRNPRTIYDHLTENFERKLVSGNYMLLTDRKYEDPLAIAISQKGELRDENFILVIFLENCIVKDKSGTFLAGNAYLPILKSATDVLRPKRKKTIFYTDGFACDFAPVASLDPHHVKDEKGMISIDEYLNWIKMHINQTNTHFSYRSLPLLIHKRTAKLFAERTS